MTNHPKTEEDLHTMIASGVEESASLDYKRAESLDKRDQKKKEEITKDVSAFANSAGGVIIYGIAEGTTPETKHLPGRLSPVSRIEHTKEWLDQICAQIQPPIDGLLIHSIPLASGPNDVAYVVVIPASTTAHQATDKRYYKRRNFMSEAMEDYEIRDVMNRRSHPLITLFAEIECSISSGEYPSVMPPVGPKPPKEPVHQLHIYAKNDGAAVAQIVVGSIELPQHLATEDRRAEGSVFSFDNHEYQLTGGYNAYSGPMTGNPQWMPILPRLHRHLLNVTLPKKFCYWLREDFNLRWTVHCDTAPPREGIITRAEIKVSMSEEYEAFERRLPH